MQKKVLRVSFLSAIAALAIIAAGCTPNGQNANSNQSATSGDQMMVNGSDEGTENTNQAMMEDKNTNGEMMENTNTNGSMMDDKKSGDAMMTNEKTFTVSGSNFSYDVKEIKVNKGDKVKIIFKNVEGFHDWNLDEFNAHTPKIQGGNQAEVEFVADKTGTFEYYCSVGSHRQMGMVGNLIVE